MVSVTEDGYANVTCANCGYFGVIDTSDYYSLSEALTENGWISKNIHGRWKQFCCRECYNVYMQDNPQDDPYSIESIINRYL